MPDTSYQDWLSFLQANPTSRTSYNQFLAKGKQPAPAAPPAQPAAPQYTAAYQGGYQQYLTDLNSYATKLNNGVTSDPTAGMGKAGGGIGAMPGMGGAGMGGAGSLADAQFNASIAQMQAQQQAYLAAVGRTGNPALIMQAQQQIAQQNAQWMQDYQAAMAQRQQMDAYNRQADLLRQQSQMMEQANLRQLSAFTAAQDRATNANQAMVPTPQDSAAGFDYAASRARRRKNSKANFQTSNLTAAAPGVGLSIPI